MKRSSYELFRIGMIAGALALAPAFAQSSASPNTGGSQPGAAATAPRAANNGSDMNGSGAATANGSGVATGTNASGQTVPGTDMNNPSHYDSSKDHSFNFGWLGLVGLAGLLGLRR